MSTMMLVAVIVLILVGISGAYMSISWWNSKRTSQDESGIQALYIAESAAASYINQLNATVTVPQPLNKQYLAGGHDWVPAENIVDFGDPSVGLLNHQPDYASFQVA